MAVLTMRNSYIWEVTTGELKIQSEGPGRVAISPDGELIARNNFLSVSILDSFANAPGNLLDLAQLTKSFFTRSPDGTLRVTSKEGNLQVWDTKSLAPTLSLQGVSWDMPAIFTQDGNQMVTMTHNTGAVTVWDTITWNALQTFLLPILEGYNRLAHKLALSPSARLLASVLEGANNSIDLWDLKTGEQLSTIGCTREPDSVVVSEKLVASSNLRLLSHLRYQHG